MVVFTPQSTFSSHQASYATVKEAVITRINKTFERGIEDVVKSLKNEVVLDLTAEKPTLKGSKKTDAAAKELEDRQFEFEYRD
jgi:ribosomal protein L14